MSNKNLISAWRKSEDEDEVLVPDSLLVHLWISRTMGIAPAQLRHSHAGWQMSMSPSLAKLHRMIAATSNILFLTVIVMRIILANTSISNCTRLDGQCFAIALRGAELALVYMAYVAGLWSAEGKLKSIMALIRHTQEIQNSLDCGNFKSKSTQRNNRLFIAYVIWQILSSVEDIAYNLWKVKSEEKGNVFALVTSIAAVIIYYQGIMGALMRMLLCAVILELKTTLSLLNDKLEDLLLQTPSMPPRAIKMKLYLRELMPQKAKISGSYSKDARLLEEDLGNIRHINRCHDIICDMVAQTDKNSGPFLLVFFMLVFLQLLITPQYLMVGLGGSTTVHFIIREINRLLLLFTDLLMLVEPCQRLQEQMDRTRCLLGRLVGQEHRCGFDPAQLDLFILQAQMRGVAVTPMGVITVGRPLVASIIGAVVTYLIIVVQSQNASAT